MASFSRRDVLRALSLGVAGSILMPVGLSACAVVSPDAQAGANAHDSTDGPPRLVVVFLRGAVDGMNVLVPYADPAYHAARPTIAVATPGSPNGAFALDSYFGLHPAMAPLLPFWQRKELAFVNASGSPDPSRSHFEAQDYMETGTPGRKTTADGWMNRLIVAMPSNRSNVQALNLGDTMPRILRGHATVASLALGRAAGNKGAIDRPQVSAAFAQLYAGNDAMGRTFRDAQAQHHELQGDMTAMDQEQKEQKMADNGAAPPNGLSIDTARLGALMRQDSRIRLAFLATGGWDTHVQQGNGQGQLANRLKPLSEGLATLAGSLGPAYRRTTIVVVSEFGRTFRENGTGGTDHGHGNVMWVMGGPVRGGHIYGEWPGIDTAHLHDGRDLAVTTDFRTVLGVVLEKHLRLPDAQLASVFPQGPQGAGKVGRIVA